MKRILLAALCICLMLTACSSPIEQSIVEVSSSEPEVGSMVEEESSSQSEVESSFEASATPELTADDLKQLEENIRSAMGLGLV